MGQCSTLPAAGEQHPSAAAATAGSTTPSHHSTKSPRYAVAAAGTPMHSHPQQRQQRDDASSSHHYSHRTGVGGNNNNGNSAALATQTHHGKGNVNTAPRNDGGGGGGGDHVMNDATPDNNDNDTSSAENSTTPLTSQRGMRMGQAGHDTANMNKLLTAVRQGVNAFDPFLNENGQKEGNDNDGAGKTQMEQHQQRSVQPGSAGTTPTSATHAHSPSSRMQQHQHHNAHPTDTNPAQEQSPEPHKSPNGSTTPAVVPQPPDSAVRTRCYRLNLETSPNPQSVVDGLHNSHSTPQPGPLVYEPPPHHHPLYHTRHHHSWSGPATTLQYSMSDDSSSIQNPTTVAVNTAKIFRGITISNDGTIISQNARASRSRSGRASTGKLGEKSRQAAKIDKAKDLVEEAVNSGGKEEGDDDSSNMVSLVIIGEYDDMKHLVRDGSKKLRDAEGLPDEALLAINKPRLTREQSSGVGGFSATTPQQPNGRYSINTADHGGDYPHASTTSPTRKRVSPHHLNQSGNNYHNPSYSPARSKHRTPHNSLPQSAPPKLKGHPRDRPSTRRLGAGDGNSGGGDGGSNSRNNSRRFIPVQESCHDIPIFGGGESDWSQALNLSRGFNSIWNCGATGNNTGTMSPNPPSPTGKGGVGDAGGNNAVMGYEGRNESNYIRNGGMDGGREGNGVSRRGGGQGGASERMDAAGGGGRSGNGGVKEVVLV